MKNKMFTESVLHKFITSIALNIEEITKLLPEMSKLI